jgi:hypothetical protein
MSASRDDWRARLYRGLFASIPLIMLPLGVFVVVIVPYGLHRLPLALQWTMVGLVFASTLGLASLFIWAWMRPLWLELNGYDPTRPWTSIRPLAITSYVAGMATMGFAIVSAFLYLQGVASTSPERVLARPYVDTFWYYAWSLMDAIPALELPRTLGWEQPLFRFTDPLNRVLLLVYKLALIGPVIAILKLLWWGPVGRSTESNGSRAGGPA